MADLGAIGSTPPDAWVTIQPLSYTGPAANTSVKGSTYKSYFPSAVSGSNSTTLTQAPFKYQKSDNAMSDYTRVLPTWAIDQRGYFPNTWLVFPANTQSTLQQLNFTFPTVGIPITGSISGKTKELNTTTGVTTVVPYRAVRLIWKPNGQVITSTKSDVNGIYTFTGLDPTALKKYLVYGVDLDGANYDAAIHDNISSL